MPLSLKNKSNSLAACRKMSGPSIQQVEAYRGPDVANERDFDDDDTYGGTENPLAVPALQTQVDELKAQLSGLQQQLRDARKPPRTVASFEVEAGEDSGAGAGFEIETVGHRSMLEPAPSTPQWHFSRLILVYTDHIARIMMQKRQFICKLAVLHLYGCDMENPCSNRK